MMSKAILILGCPQGSLLDLIFVLDGSASVTVDNFEIVKNWVKEVSRNLDIENGVTQIGVIQYSYYNDNKYVIIFSISQISKTVVQVQYRTKYEKCFFEVILSFRVTSFQ